MFIELLRRRRSVRKFTSQRVEQEKLDILLESLVRSPHSGKEPSWHFVVIENRETIVQLAGAKPHGAKLLQGAPLAVAICGDTGKSDVWVENSSIAAMNIHLTATDLGLGSCWVQFRNREYQEGVLAREFIATLLNLPEEMDVLAVMAIGYPGEEKPGREREMLGWNQVSYEKYGQNK